MSADPAGRSTLLPRLVCRTTRLDDIPIGLRSTPADADTVWLSAETKLLAYGASCRIAVPISQDRFNEASALLGSLFTKAEIADDVDVPGSGPVAFGTFTFDWRDAGSKLHFPSLVYGQNETAAWKTEIVPEPGEDNGRRNFTVHDKSQDNELEANPQAAYRGDLAGWLPRFEEVLRRLEAGNLEKMVLARRVDARSEQTIDRGELLSILARRFPGCYTFGFGGFVGSSPELLVRRLGQVVDSMPIAGSAPRSSDGAEDDRIGLKLMASSKDRTEHRLTKEAVVAALEPFCSALESDREPSLLTLSNVQHLSTKVQGRLKDWPDCLELAGALHPTPAVCGVPAGKALDAIRSVEGFKRGRYAGPVGWMDHRGDGEWAIALRCAELNGASAALYAGAGIVAGSDPLSEFRETELKLQAMQAALQEAAENRPN